MKNSEYIYDKLLNNYHYVCQLCIQNKINIINSLIYFSFVSFYIVMVSYPLLKYGIVPGHDLWFHVVRIESIREGLLSGQFPVRIYPYGHNGYGYLTGIFYPDLFLYFPAILRIAGFDFVSSYRIFIISLHIISFFTCYWSFEKLIRIREIALYSSLLYLGCIYRLVDFYARAAVGEYLTMTFMPMALISFFLMIGRDKKYIFSFIFSMSCILQSHILGTLLCCVGCLSIFIFVSIFHFRRIFNIQTFYTLIQSFLILLLVNIWYYYPFIEYYSKIDMNMKYAGFQSGLNSVFGCYQFVMVVQFYIGIPLILITFAGIYPVIRQQHTYFIHNIKILFVIFLFISVILSLLWTNIIPFKELLKVPVVGKYFNVLQFPFRLNTYPAITWSLVGGISLYFIFRKLKYKTIYVISILTISFIINYTSMGFMEYYDCQGNNKKVGQTFGINKSDDGNQQLRERLKQDKIDNFLNGYKYYGYLFRDFGDWTKINFNNSISILPSNNKKEDVKNFYKKNLHIKFDANLSEDAFAVFPLWYYSGYKARICDKKCQDLTLVAGPLHRISAYIPKGKHNIEIFFSEKWQWRVAEFISIITIILLITKQLLRSSGFKRIIRRLS